MVSSTDQLLDLRPLLLVAAAISLVVITVLLVSAYRRGPGRGHRGRAEHGMERHRLAIVESIDIDRHRRLVIVRRDSVEHLVLVGGSHDLVVEADIARPTPQRLADLPVLRGTRTEPEDLPRARVSPVAAETPDLAPPPIQRAPARSTDFSESYGVLREPPPLDHDDFGPNRTKVMNVIDSKSLERDAGGKPVSTFPHPALGGPPAPMPFRATMAPTTDRARTAASPPVRPRRSPPPEAPASRAAPQRTAEVPRTPLSETADATRDEAPSSGRRTLATPFLRSPPPAPTPREPELDTIAEDATTTEFRQDDAIVVAAPDVPAEVEAAPRSESHPPIEIARAEADVTTDRSPEPEVSAAPPADRDPIDRLEAEIARMLGRTKAG